MVWYSRLLWLSGYTCPGTAGNKPASNIGLDGSPTLFSAKPVNATIFRARSKRELLLVTHTSILVITTPLFTTGKFCKAASYWSRKKRDRKKCLLASYLKADTSKSCFSAPFSNWITLDSPFCCEKILDMDNLPNCRSVRNPQRFCPPEISVPVKGKETFPASTFFTISSSFPS